MPIYEYRRPDGTTFEVMQRFSDDALTSDPETGVPVQRVLHSPAVHFKGKGFYNTDYGTRKRERELSTSGDEGAAKGETKQPERDVKKDSSSTAADSSTSGSSATPGSSASTGSTSTPVKKAS